MDSGEFKQIFTHKLGPLPVAGWAAISVGGVVAYRYIIAKRSSTATSSDPATGVATTDPNSLFPGSTGADYVGQLATGNQTYGSTTTQTQITPAPADNVSWGQRVENWLIANGVDPSQAVTTVSAYLNGSDIPLTAQQQGIFNTALTQFGVPPEGILAAPPVVTSPVPPTTTPTTPVLPPAWEGANNGEPNYAISPYPQYAGLYNTDGTQAWMVGLHNTSKPVSTDIPSGTFQQSQRGGVQTLAPSGTGIGQPNYASSPYPQYAGRYNSDGTNAWEVGLR